MITAHAITQWNICFENSISYEIESEIQSANSWEDLNLIRKWTKYSHFYHPYKKLNDLTRYDSSMRVIELEYEILSLDLKDFYFSLKPYQALGHAIHHLQDVTVPAHVVPVMHALKDGFEEMRLTQDDLPKFRFDQKYCGQLKQKKTNSLFDILFESAEITLLSLETPLEIYIDGEKRILNYKAFWQPSEKEEFGSYGVLGNHFGESEFEQGGVAYQVSLDQMKVFKRKAVERAIIDTMMTLKWVWSLSVKY